MPHAERNTYAALLVGVITIIYFGLQLRDNWAAGLYDGINGVSVWAQDVLWIIPICIILSIGATIGVNILHAILTQTPNPSFVSDERDAAIGKLGSTVTMVFASIGFLAALIGMAMGWGAIAGMSLILFGFAGADFAGNVAKIAAYRFGI